MEAESEKVPSTALAESNEEMEVLWEVNPLYTQVHISYDRKPPVSVDMIPFYQALYTTIVPAIVELAWVNWCTSIRNLVLGIISCDNYNHLNFNKKFGLQILQTLL